ncbi:MAG: ankyrin repeat domain-containing protein [Candidatus Margulisbacteria bacterium]|nr:ankyrin repeat domain-containing protein [Candidatus Margulisiibacteriota bacterium]
MNKIISTNNLNIEKFLRQQLVLLDEGFNIFAGDNGTAFIDRLIKYSGSVRDRIELLSQYKTLNFLTKHKPEPGENTRSKAITAIYSCLHNLREDNQNIILLVLARNFGMLGFIDPETAEEKLLKTKPYDDKHLFKNELLCSIRMGNFQNVQQYITLRADVQVKDENNLSALMKAVYGGNEIAFKYFVGYTNKDLSILRGLAHITSIEEQWREGLENSMGEFKKMIAALIQAGADINDADMNGDTVLMNIIKLGHKDLLSMLLERDVNIEARNNQGKTALMIAVHYKRTDMVELLLNAGADTEVPEV